MTIPINEKTDTRISILDGFRFIAILFVMLYHYYTRWMPPTSSINFYPYNNTHSFFQYGFFGVEFFFIISGFVIAYTFTTTNNLFDFWKKRIIRLFPAMLICSIITFIVFTFLDRGNLFPNSHKIENIFYSITFIRPCLLDFIFKFVPQHTAYINGSYWSLWPEIQFYFIASCVYYFNPAKFIRNFLIVALMIYLGNVFMQKIQVTHLFHFSGITYTRLNYYSKVTNYFNIPEHILWFLMGVLFFNLYTKNYQRYTPAALAFVILFQLYDCGKWELRLITTGMIILFLLFLYYPDFLKFLNNKIIRSVGIASYSLYLIHENIGVLFINKYGIFLGQYSFLFPVILIITFSIFSVVLYKFVEKPLGTYLKNKFVRDKN